MQVALCQHCVKYKAERANFDKTPITKDEREKAIDSIKDPNLKEDETAIRDAVLNDRIEKAVQALGWGVGGDNRRIVESGTALIQGLISGDVNKAVANASAPYIANEIAKAIPDDNKEGRIIAHGIANTALALAKGENAGAQSLGAMTAEAVGMLSQELYHKQPSELSEEEKATVSAFASLAAGIAGGLVGGDSSSAANAAEAGKTTVENNYLSSQNVVDMKKELEEADKTGADKTGIYDKYGKISKENRDKAIAEIKDGDSFDAIGAWEELNGGVNVADALKISGLFDDLSSEDRAQLVNFVKAESAQSAQEIYQSLSLTAKVALQGKEIVENSGIKGSLPGSGVSSLGIKGGNKKGTQQKEQDKESQEAVKPLDVGSYKELKDRSKVGDGLEHDHIPSFAALKKAKETELGRPLTKEESNKLFNNATAVEVPKDVHAAGPTYKGKNSATQVQKDAADLCGAQCRDTEALRQNMVNRGYDPKLVDDAIKKIIERNQEKGVTK